MADKSPKKDNAKKAGKGRAAAWKAPGSAKTGPIPMVTPKKT